MTHIKWLGHASFELVTDKGKHVYLDPWLDNNPATLTKIEDIKRADIVCVSHGHRDHIGNAIEIVRNTEAMLVCSPEIGHYANSKGIKYGEDSCTLNIGGSAVIEGIKIHMTFASHVSELYGEEWLREKRMLPGSGSVGYVIETEQGVRVYFAGDTGLFGDMRIIGEIYNPHIALLPVGGKYNMGPKLASIAAKWIRPEVIIPMHYNTYPAIKQNMQALEDYIKNSVTGVKLMALKVGERFKYGD